MFLTPRVYGFHRFVRYVPNTLSASRIIASLFAANGVLTHHYGQTLALLCYCGVSDAIDGIIARKFNAETNLGRILDPIADKTAVTALTLSLSIDGLFPWTLTSLMITRDVLIVGLGIRALKIDPNRDFTPTLISKVNTGVTMAALVATVATPLGYVPMDLTRVCQWTAGTTTLISGLHYLKRV